MAHFGSQASTRPCPEQSPLRAGPAQLEQLLAARADLWRGRAAARTSAQGIATGFPALDRVLPWGGWPADGLIELLTDQPGAGLALILPALVRLCAQTDDQCALSGPQSAGGGGWQRQTPRAASLLWVNPPLIPYAPGLAAHGLDPAHVVLVDAPGQGAWAMEQGLRLGGCMAVIGWADESGSSSRRGRCWSMPTLRRLQLAASGRSTPAFLFRPGMASGQPSPAPLRLDVEPSPDGIELTLRKLRGGRAGARLGLSVPSAGSVVNILD